MANVLFDIFPAEPAGPNTEFPLTRLENGSVAGSNIAINSIIDQPRQASFERQMVTWRTPHLGYVKMYINPQSIKIIDAKDITTARTKGGFVIQYAGEKMTDIQMTGTTGSSGMEGINILHSVYRSEQEAFEGIAVALDERLSALQFDTLFNTINQAQRVNIIGLATSALQGAGRPQPTLASLATNIECFFQGILYRGFFKAFSVDESAETPGLFNYSISFEAYAKQGTRRNFMPWHQQPFHPAAAYSNPYTFTTLIDGQNISVLPPTQLANNTEPDSTRSIDASFLAKSSRVVATAANQFGGTITGDDLRNR